MNKSRMDELESARKKYRYANPAMGVKVNAVYSVKVLGHSQTTVAQILNHSQTWVADCIKCYEQNGIEGLRPLPKSGRPKKINDKQFSSIVNNLLEHNIAITPQQVVISIKHKWDTSYHITNVRKRLHALNISPKLPKKIHVNRAPVQVCNNWSKNIVKTVRKMEEKGATVLIQDESIINIDGMYQKRWIHTGTDYNVSYTGSHKKVVVTGMLSTDGRQIFRTCEKFDARSFIDILKIAHKKFGKICVIADNAAQHATAKVVKRWLRKHRNDVRLVFLPPGAPHLSAIEEAWHQAKRMLFEIHHYDVSDRRKMISEFFRTYRFNLDVLKYLRRKTVPPIYF